MILKGKPNQCRNGLFQNQNCPVLSSAYIIVYKIEGGMTYSRHQVECDKISLFIVEGEK